MKFYLSSYKIGNNPEKLIKLIPKGKSLGYISNALDFSNDLERKKKHIEKDISSLKDLGINVENLNLKDYFNKKEELKNKLLSYCGVWISGGNVFILRQAMKLSGFDEIIKEKISTKEEFLYAGYSAAGCVLSKNLKAYQNVDNHNDFPYNEIKETIWEGLDIIDFVFLPHYDSNHKESKAINKEIKFCIDNKILFKAIRDGEVLIFNYIH